MTDGGKSMVLLEEAKSYMNDWYISVMKLSKVEELFFLSSDDNGGRT